MVLSDSTEVFSYSFAGYYAAENAYDLDEKRDVLADKTGQAVPAVRGPTQVLLEWAPGCPLGHQPPRCWRSSRRLHHVLPDHQALVEAPRKTLPARSPKVPSPF